MKIFAQVQCPIRFSREIAQGVSFGATRELAFLRASPLENGDKVKIYFPQTNNGVFSFGRDVNILFKHGVNALSEEEQDGKGCVSVSPLFLLCFCQFRSQTTVFTT
jgi:hypothetical protein